MQGTCVFLHVRTVFICLCCICVCICVCVHMCVSIVWCINQNPYNTPEYLSLDSSHREGWWPAACMSASVPAKALHAAKGSRGAKRPPSLTRLPTPNPSAFPLTSQPRCGAGPARSSANRREPVLGATSPPASSFLWLLPPICAHTHTHIKISVLMRARHCLYSLCDIWPSTKHHFLFLSFSFWSEVWLFNCSCFDYWFFLWMSQIITMTFKERSNLNISFLAWNHNSSLIPKC